jgi:hypothetical protein
MGSTKGTAFGTTVVATGETDVSGSVALGII